MKRNKNLVLIVLIAILSACTSKEKKSDAYGNFEATEIMVASETSGRIVKLEIEEGQEINEGEITCITDTTQLILKKEQIQAQIDAISTKTENINSQVKVQEEQKKTLLIEKNRLEKLLKDGAATERQMDEINGKINVIDKQIQAIETQDNSTSGEIRALQKQIEQIEDQIKKSYIKNPIKGIVLEKYAEQSEIAVPGKNLYKIANLQTMFLRVFVSGEQLHKIKIGKKIKIMIDGEDSSNIEYEGEVAWISQQAEFTPKIIQTKEDRINLVYAVKLKVINDGKIKIGMPGEISGL